MSTNSPTVKSGMNGVTEKKYRLSKEKCLCVCDRLIAGPLLPTGDNGRKSIAAKYFCRSEDLSSEQTNIVNIHPNMFIVHSSVAADSIPPLPAFLHSISQLRGREDGRTDGRPQNQPYVVAAATNHPSSRQCSRAGVGLAVGWHSAVA